MNIGIFGGSFNPIHFGHIGLAQWIVNHTDVDEVWLMVSPSNPLKDASTLANEQERFTKAQQAIEGIQGLRVSDFEFHLPRPSYTVDTLRALAATYPEHTFSLIIGQDNWDIWQKWREHDYIEQHFRLIIYPRPCATTRPPTDAPNILWLANAPCFDISSTQIRNNFFTLTPTLSPHDRY